MAKISDENIEDAVVVDEPAVVEEPVVVDEPVVVEKVETIEPAPVTPNVVYVQAPAEPKKRGNRGVGAAIAVASGVVFAAALAIATAIIGFFNTSTFSFAFLSSPNFYIPVLFFVIGFVLLVLIANRANWWAYIFGSILVGIFVYFGTIGFGLLVGGAVLKTPGEVAEMYRLSLGQPFIIIAALLAREVSLWFGSLISRRARTVKVRNAEARAAHQQELADRRAEYDRSSSASAAS